MYVLSAEMRKTPFCSANLFNSGRLRFTLLLQMSPGWGLHCLLLKILHVIFFFCFFFLYLSHNRRGRFHARSQRPGWVGVRCSWAGGEKGTSMRGWTSSLPEAVFFLPKPERALATQMSTHAPVPTLHKRTSNGIKALGGHFASSKSNFY